MLKDRTFNIVVVDKNNPRKFDVNNKGIQRKYDGKKQIVKI